MTVRSKTVGALFTMAAAVAVLTAPSPASASPLGCATYEHPMGFADARMARCTAGDGQYRIVLRCTKGFDHLPDYYIYGDWKSPSATSFSSAWCYSGTTSGFLRGYSIGIR
ncbi:hypothetical protein [Actinoplanes xinjiangensis]|uniref:hypothetical protein n=1 Tax=Actinoplanes xinjiangensis TaxID=512350 RepID=UPI0034453BB7